MAYPTIGLSPPLSRQTLPVDPPSVHSKYVVRPLGHAGPECGEAQLCQNKKMRSDRSADPLHSANCQPISQRELLTGPMEILKAGMKTMETWPASSAFADKRV